MANLLNKLVYIKRAESFTEELKTTYQKSIVFIEDSGVLWTHGKTFGLTATEVSDLTERIGTLESTKWFNGIAEISGASVFNAAEGATVIRFGGDDLITVTVDEDGVHFSGKEVSAEGDDYISASGSTDGSNKVTVTSNVKKMSEVQAEDQENSKEEITGLADALDVKNSIAIARNAV